MGVHRAGPGIVPSEDHGPVRVLTLNRPAEHSTIVGAVRARRLLMLPRRTGGAGAYGPRLASAVSKPGALPRSATSGPASSAGDRRQGYAH